VCAHQKIYTHINNRFNPKSQNPNRSSLDDLCKWILEDRIDTRRAATAVHILEVIAKIQIPSLIEQKINELEAEAERIRKVIPDRIAAQAERTRSMGADRTAFTGSSSVDNKDKDSEGQIV